MFRRSSLPTAIACLVSGLSPISVSAEEDREGGKTTVEIDSGELADSSSSSSFRENFMSDDGWLDVSLWLEKPYGFFPMIIPITEPAVGYGAVAAGIFLNSKNI